MTTELRFGVIGTGMMGCEHIWNIALVDGCSVVAIADPHAPSREWGIASVGSSDVEVFDDHRTLIAEADVDAVVVATPNHTHADVLDALWGTDIHVLVEKPLCTTVEDARTVADRAAAHDGVFWVGLEYRFMPPVARALDLVPQVCGDVSMIAIREHRFPFLPKVGDWNRFAHNTGGTLVEKCCHFFDLMTLVAGARPVRVYASGGQDVNHLDESYDGRVPDILDNAFVIVDYDDGTRASLDLCMFADASKEGHRVAVTGSRGQIECFLPSGEVVTGRRGAGVESEVVEVPPDIMAAGFHHGATYHQHVAFRDAVVNGTPPLVDAQAGLVSVAIGAAAERSVRDHRPVDLTEELTLA